MGRLVQMIVAGTLLASIAQPAVSLNGPASGLVAVYAPIAQAVVLHDGGDSVAGLGDQLWLQAPTATDRRFPSTRWMAKVKGDEVAA
jgi:hypothetical protein